MARVLVTGGSGFVGRHLVDALIARGDEVRVLDVAGAEGLPREAEFLPGSILDRADLDRAMTGVDRLFPLAGIAHLWAREKASFDRVNRLGSETVLKAAAEHGIARVVHCSTESILLPKKRNGKHFVDEAAALSLNDMPGPYTRSKYLGELAALDAARDGLDVVVVNPTVPIGAGDRNMTPPAEMLALFLAGGSPFFLDCVLNLVDVRDLADGIARAGEHGRAGERYILGGENIPLRRLLAVLERLSGRRMPKRAIPAPIALAAGTMSEWVSGLTGGTPVASREAVRIALRSAPFDSAKAKRELGYAPRPIEGALTEAVEWLAAKQPAANARRH
ncbi:MAG: NAD-dependent epimerase/dehydratase family protein [Pseudomonadota bacterium]|nr:NAD-dependent epimerase/dehydratase family protein [Pseudomonadota bacterium]